MHRVKSQATAYGGGPFLGILSGVPLSLAVWVVAGTVALVALR